MAEALKQALQRAGFSWSDEALDLVVSHLLQEGIAELQALDGEMLQKRRGRALRLLVPTLLPGCQIGDFDEHWMWPDEVQEFMKKLMTALALHSACFSLLHLPFLRLEMLLRTKESSREDLQGWLCRGSKRLPESCLMSRA